MSALRSVSLLALIIVALGGCATPETAGKAGADWSRPMAPSTTPPVFLHDVAIANPPYPRPSYANYLDEPTRFEFRPRRSIVIQEDTGPYYEAVEAAPTLPYIENGILYVDPNQ